MLEYFAAALQDFLIKVTFYNVQFKGKVHKMILAPLEFGEQAPKKSIGLGYSRPKNDVLAREANKQIITAATKMEVYYPGTFDQ